MLGYKQFPQGGGGGGVKAIRRVEGQPPFFAALRRRWRRSWTTSLPSSWDRAFFHGRIPLPALVAPTEGRKFYNMSQNYFLTPIFGIPAPRDPPPPPGGRPLTPGGCVPPRPPPSPGAYKEACLGPSDTPYHFGFYYFGAMGSQYFPLPYGDPYGHTVHPDRRSIFR